MNTCLVTNEKFWWQMAFQCLWGSSSSFGQQQTCHFKLIHWIIFWIKCDNKWCWVFYRVRKNIKCKYCIWGNSLSAPLNLHLYLLKAQQLLTLDCLFYVSKWYKSQSWENYITCEMWNIYVYFSNCNTWNITTAQLQSQNNKLKNEMLSQMMKNKLPRILQNWQGIRLLKNRCARRLNVHPDMCNHVCSSPSSHVREFALISW